MPKTITEKIFSEKTGKDVYAGEIVTAEVDTIMSHDVTTVWALEPFEKLGNCFKDASRSVVFFDHTVPASSVNIATLHKACFSFIEKHNIKSFYGQGVCHQLLPEKGFVVPGSIVVGADSHTCTHGAFGAFATGLGSTDIAVCWATGKNWFKIPETININITGKLPENVYAKDLALEVMRNLTSNGATYKAIEYSGNIVDELSMESRMTLTNMAVEAGAKAGIIASDKKTIDYLKPRTNKKLKTLSSDSGAEYAKEISIDASSLSPLVAVPHAPDNVKELSAVEGITVNNVFIGSCTNGRIEDLRIAHSVIKNQKISKNTMCVVVPASAEVYLQAIKEGIVEDLVKAGVVFCNPGCGACLGRHQGVLADDDVCVSTTNRNFQGRMGSPKSKIYLASPYVAAKTALKGELSG